MRGKHVGGRTYKGIMETRGSFEVDKLEEKNISIVPDMDIVTEEIQFSTLKLSCGFHRKLDVEKCPLLPA